MRLSFIENISILIELLANSPFTIFALLIAILIFVTLLINLYLDKKYLKILFPLIYILFLSLIVFYGHIDIVKSFKFFIGDLFSKKHFPSISLFLVIIFTNAIGLFVNIFSKRNSNYSKFVTIFIFSFFQFLFSLFIYMVYEQNILILELENLYQIKGIISILDISVLSFLAWIFLLVVGFGLNMVNKYGNEKETDTITLGTWNEVQKMIEQNNQKISEEMDIIKKQIIINRVLIQKQCCKMEEQLNSSEAYMFSQLQEVTDGIKSKELLAQLNFLYEMIKEKYETLTMELENVIKNGNTSDLQIKLFQLEGRMKQTNEQVAQQLKLLEVNPVYEIEKVKDYIETLEVLLKRYIVDINHQLKQTRKEIEISEQRSIRKNNTRFEKVER